MSQFKLKVCGMRDEKNIRQLVKLKPDYIGFIFYPESKRYIGDDFDMKILDVIPVKVKRVGVFVNELLENVINTAENFGLNYVQLHGTEPPEYCHELQELNIKVIKAFGISEDFDFEKLFSYDPCCDYFLFDTHSNQYGGTGLKFNWNLIYNYDYPKQFFLSGGIGLEDIHEIQKIDPSYLHAVDINSRFETAPGMKDILSVKKFHTLLKDMKTCDIT